jgi:PAS domain S-box-containing protein
MANSPSSSYEETLKDVGKQSKGSAAFKLSKTYPAWIILIITLAISAFLYDFMGNQVRTDNELAFEKATSSVLSRIEDKFDTKIQIMNSVNNVFKNSYVVRDVFEINTKNSVNTYPSVVSFQKANKVTPETLGDFVYNTRSQGYYDMRVWPEGERDLYYLTEYVVPFDGNEKRIGYDVATEEIIKNTIESASKDNSLKITSSYKTGKTDLGFYLIAPLYELGLPTDTPQQRNDNFTSAVMMEINTDLFYGEALGEGIASDSTIIFEIVDLVASDESNAFYASDNYETMSNEDEKALIENNIDLTFGDHTIRIKFETVPGFGGEFSEYLPYLALGTGILVSLVLFGFVISVITSRQRALDLADRMTKSQRRIVDSSQDIIAVLEMDGRWKTMNPASEKIFGLFSEDMIGQNINTLFHSDEDKEEFFRVVNMGREDYTERIDIQMIGNKNEIKWMNWSLSISVKDSQVYAIGRDVTLEKEAEELQVMQTKQVELAGRFSKEANESKSFFMVQLSHQLRNSLTGILGYLQLIHEGYYETDEELKEYVSLAETSSEEIFTFVSDIVEITTATEDKGTTPDLANVNFYDVYKDVAYKIYLIIGLPDVKTNINEEAKNAHFLGERNIMTELLLMCFGTLCTGQENQTVTIQAEENTFEGATEIQILGPGNAVVEKMINAYKSKKSGIIDALEEDEGDVLLNLAIIESNVRRLNGSVVIESFGGDEGNVIMMTLPLQKK